MNRSDVLPKTKQKHNPLSLLIAFLLPLLAGGVGTIATSSSLTGWYPRLKKPAWNPPAWVFGPVWTLLYLMMGGASWFVWQKRPANNLAVRNALTWYGLQLGLNSLWSFIFFGWRRIDLALIEITALWAAILATLIKFYRIRPISGWLLLPYFLWSSFATVLNATIWWLNRNKKS